MKYKLFILIFGILLALPLISALEVYPTNENVELKFLCTLNNAIPSASAVYNITISYPNGTTYINNNATTSMGQGAFNYTTNFTITGIYMVQSFCYDGSY